MIARSGIEPNETGKFTVPTIHHTPTNKHIMESAAISKFLEDMYPDPPVQLTSELGDKLVAQIWSQLSKTFRASIMPREVAILNPPSAEYFIRNHMGGASPEDLLDAEKEEEAWKSVEGSMQDIGVEMKTNQAEGSFLLGAHPSYADFTIVGAMQSGRMVDENVFQRIVKHPGFADLYEACEPYMLKRT